MELRRATGGGAPVIRQVSDLDQLDRSWSALESAGSTPMQDFIWSRACAEAFCEDGRLRVITAGDAEHVTAIAPLTHSKGWPPRLESIGVDELFEPTDFLGAEGAALEALADRLARAGTPLLLWRVLADSPIISALERAFAGRGWVRVSTGAPYPYIELGRGWSVEAQLNARRRSDLRRAQRHAAALGEVRYEIVSPTATEVQALLDEAFEVEARSWKGTSGTALALDPLRAGFFRRYAAAACDQGILRMVFLRINGVAIAMQVALESRDRFWLLKIGYDEHYARCSPGSLVMQHSLTYAADRGLRSYELLGGAAPWTEAWTRQLRPCVTVRAYPLSIPGAMALGWDAARWALARARRASDCTRSEPAAANEPVADGGAP
jgi:CelD/BcsL family acetyltransferase involved in cellulose biosynthesis